MVKVCTRCGAEFESAKGHAKYCPSCRREVRTEIARKSHGDRAGSTHTCDSDERISICLRCTMPAHRCNGDCYKLKISPKSGAR